MAGKLVGIVAALIGGGIANATASSFPSSGGENRNYTAASNNSSYNEQRASRAAAFSGIAYCASTHGHGVAAWDCRACKQYPDVSAQSFVSSKSLQNGFVAFDPHDGPKGAIVAVFAGTDPLEIREWIADIDTIPVDYPACSGCKVHQGFYSVYGTVRQQAHALVSEYASKHPEAPIHVHGHSLGGAIAVHLAVELATSALAKRVELVYTFGQPRVGNAAFVAYAERVLGERPHFRVTHRRDPVPHLPPLAFRFVHLSREAFYLGSSTGAVRVCDGSGEDPRCSNQFKADVVATDHLFYLGFDYATNYLYCKL